MKALLITTKPSDLLFSSKEMASFVQMQKDEIVDIKNKTYSALAKLKIENNDVDFVLVESCRDAFEKFSGHDRNFDLVIIRVHAEDECESLGIFEFIKSRTKANSTKIISIFDQLGNGKQYDFDPQHINLQITMASFGSQNLYTSLLKSLIRSPTVYVSYGNDKECKYFKNFSILLHELFPQIFPHLKLLQDDRDLSMRGSLGDFFEGMSSSDYVITLLNNHYFKSYYCMDELTKLFLNEESDKPIQSRIFPIVFEDARYIFEDSCSKFDTVYDFWQKEEKTLKISSMKMSRNSLKVKRYENTIAINENLNLVQETLSDMHIKHSDDLVKNRMLDLFISINDQLLQDRYKAFYSGREDIQKAISNINGLSSEYYFNLRQVASEKNSVVEIAEVHS